MIRDFKLLLFSLKFEETTGSQAKKQYDGYAQFCSNENRKLPTGCYTGINAKLFLIVPVIVDNTIRLPIPIVVNNTNDAIIIKYEIDVNNTSSIYTKINFKSSFLGLCYYLVR